eukprot:CAMPEP_0117068838 /NCGR_PEP_ID=MMETSP0472-20121206/48253_1 /TAXON_ID=693140 ORGANISM="Tiarina fusus, Strain LIS" /NCGR_SAMPLE_ID=MMETSP0472 /ASSEMBLY_ACC=CAM_ASM_000603 /LENGTH=1432 /DNA_ID=CAMNT_0004791077 /DNA_START=28 /DNA_END=4328 /DNA_ORIENTATION=-
MTKRLPPLSRRRPKRQRNPTTLYTDDNPSTFTVKKKKGDAGNDSDDSPPPPEKPKPSYFFVEESLPLKRPYRRKKPTEKAAASLVSPRVVSNDVPAVPLVGIPGLLPDPNAPPVKRKRGRPPSKKKMLERQLAAQQPEAVPAAPAPAPPPTRSPAKAPVGTTAWTPSLHDTMGTFLSHSVTVAPILPPTQHDKNHQQHVEQRYPTVFGNGLGVTTPLDDPKWSPLYCPDVYFEDDYESDENRRLDSSVLPVTRSITCVTTRKPDNQYMAVGDTNSMGTHIRPVARLETVACQQRAREEQEKIREQKQRKKGKLRSLVMDTSQTTIHALGMIGTRVVLATACELECMDVPSQTSLWVCPLSADRLVTSLDMHMSTYDVLVSCSLYQHTQSDLPRNATTPLATSPLMLLQHSENNVEICDANSPILLKSPCCTAMWDASTTSESRLLFVAVSDTENELELVLVQGGSIDSWKVACKTRIPVKASNHQTKLCQSPEGLYTLVASSRGIRLYQTETLQLINVYGDNLALHGKSVVWQDCLLLGKPNRAHKPDMVANKNLEYGDWLNTKGKEKSKEEEEDKESELGLYVIGVPNFKGPKELCETLHVWRTEQASTVPALSIPLPPKSDGVQGLVPAPPMLGGDRIVLSTRSGQGHVLLPRMQSNFAGIMYPAGYRTINDNLVFVEDEDDLDNAEVVQQNEPDEEEDVDVVIPEEDEMDEELKEALRQSLLEQKRQKERESVEDVDVDVLSHISDDTDDRLIPCRPEAYLRQFVNTIDDSMEAGKMMDQQDGETRQETTGEQLAESHIGPLFISNILESMPNVHKKKPASSNELGFTVTAKIAVVTNPIPNRQGRGKRSRAASLEATLKSSIDPHLQRYMISKQGVWSDGSRCMLQAAPALDSSASYVKHTNHVTPSPAMSNGIEMSKGLSAELAAQNGLIEIASGMVENHITKMERKVESQNGSADFRDQPKSECRPKLSVRPDEAAVALGLLGLSPCHNNSPSESGGSDVPVSDSVQQPLLSVESKDDGTGASSYLNASLERANLSTVSGTPCSGQGMDSTLYATAESSATDTSDRGSIIADTASENASSQCDSQIATKHKSLSCVACRGRQVIHTCGKRSLPIDFDEVAKAERERKIKEEEEKKRARAEKRRQADARRREARKQKQQELEERRRREEEDIRLERERQKRLEENANGNILHTDPDQQRREMIVASYVDYTASAHAPATQWPPRDQPAVAMTSVDYNRQRMANHDYSAEAVTKKSPAVAHYVSYAKTETYEAPRAATTQPSISINGRTSSAGALSSADALVALANLSAAKPSAVAPVEETIKQAEAPAFAYAANTTTPSHGFSTGLPAPAAEPVSAIPSFASLRGQTNGISNSFISYKDASGNGRAAFAWQAAPAVDRASEYYTERYYNPVTGKEYTPEEKASFRTG